MTPHAARANSIFTASNVGAGRKTSQLPSNLRPEGTCFRASRLFACLRLPLGARKEPVPVLCQMRALVVRRPWPRGIIIFG